MAEHSRSSLPVTKWAQRKDQLLITFCVEDCKDTDVGFHSNKIIFHGCGGPANENYDVELELFKEIDSKKCQWQQTSRSIFLHVRKKETGPFWPRLLKSNIKQHWLKIDFEKMKDEDDSDSADAEEELARMERNTLGSDEMIDPCHVTSSEDEDALDHYPHSFEDEYYDKTFERALKYKHHGQADQVPLWRRLEKSKYSHPKITEDDVYLTLATFPGLKQSFEQAVPGIGKVLLRLTGTIPVKYKDGVYNIPISISVGDKYPKARPLCYVTPTASMELRPGRFVDIDGKVHTPYLDNWDLCPDNSLADLVRTFMLFFAQDPPVVGKRGMGNTSVKKKRTRRRQRRNKGTAALPDTTTEKAKPSMQASEKKTVTSTNVMSQNNNTGARKKIPTQANVSSGKRQGSEVSKSSNQISAGTMAPKSVNQSFVKSTSAIDTDLNSAGALVPKSTRKASTDSTASRSSNQSFPGAVAPKNTNQNPKMASKTTTNTNKSSAKSIPPKNAKQGSPGSSAAKITLQDTAENKRNIHAQTKAFTQSQSSISSETTSFRFIPPLQNSTAKIHLMSFIQESPEHLAKLEQKIKPFGRIDVDSYNVTTEITAKDKAREKPVKAQCIDTLKAFFSDFSVQTVQVKQFNREMIGQGPTTLKLKQIKPGCTEISVAGLAKDVAKKIHEITQYDNMTSKRKNASQEKPNPPPTSTAPKEDENQTRELGVPKWLLKYMTSKIAEGRYKWSKVRLDFRTEGKIGLIGEPRDADQFCSFLMAEVLDLLDKYSCEAVKVPKEYHKNVIGRNGMKVNQLRDVYHVDVTIPPSNSDSLDIIVEGEKDHVQSAKDDILKLIEHFVELFYSKVPTRIHIIGEQERVDAAKNHMTEFVKGLEFVVLKIAIEQSHFGKLIGKGGQNIRSLVDEFHGVFEIIMPRPASCDQGIFVTGDATGVFILVRHLEDKFSAKLLGQIDVLMPSWQPGRRHSGQQNTDRKVKKRESIGEVCAFDQGDHELDVTSNFSEDSLTSSLPVSLRGSPPPPAQKVERLFIWEEGPGLPTSFVIRSTVHWKILQNVMKDFGRLRACGVIEVAMDVTGLSASASEARINECRSRFENFFENYAGYEMTFDPDFSIDRISFAEDDLRVEWIADEFLEISGVKNAVELKYAEFEAIKNRKKTVVFKWNCGKNHVLQYVAETTAQLEKLKLAMTNLGSITFTEKQVIATAELPEMEEKGWQKKCKENLRKFFGNYTSESVDFHPLSTVDRTDSVESDLRVTWTGNKTCVVVCGLKSAVEVKLAALENIKNRKKSVSYKWRISEVLLLAFVKESPTRLQDLQDALSDIGAPVFSETCIVVNGELPEISSAHDWEDECRKALTEFFQDYSADRIEVPPVSVARASQLGENCQGVITKWADDQNSLVIFGLRYAVRVKVASLRRTLQQIEAEERKSHVQATATTSSQDESPAAISPEEYSGINVRVLLAFEENKIKCLQAHAKNSELRNVELTVHTATNGMGLLLKGKPSDVLKAKTFALSVVVEELIVQKYGVYELLTDNNIFMEVIGMKFNCTLLVEQIEKEETDDEAFEYIEIEDVTDAKSPYGRLSVNVEEGDLTNETVDMIVNTTDKAFGFAGPLSRAILAKAGNNVLYECRQKRLQGDDMIVSSAGRLKCKKVLHVALPGPYEAMDSLIMKILTTANHHGMSSITMPTIGAGGGGWQCHEIAKSMHDGIMRYCGAYPNPRSLRNVKVMLFPAMAHHDKQEFYDHLQTAYSAPHPTNYHSPKVRTSPTRSKRGWLNKVFNYFSSTTKPSHSNTGALMPSRSTFFDDSDNGDPYKPQGSAVDGIEIQSKKTTSGEYAKVLFSSNNKENVEKARAEVSKFIELHLKDFELHDKAISKLKQEQIDEIKKISSENNVRIILDSRKDNHIIKIQGRGEFASKANDEVRKIIANIASVLPNQWLPMTKQQKAIKVELNNTSQEYKEVVALLRQANSSGEGFAVRKVERVQNPLLYQQYQIRKEEISSHVTNPVVERQLFHGTTSDTVDKICSTGFDRGFAGKNATMYGRGVYFSTLSSYSSSYAMSSWDGSKYMFLANVLTGDYCVGSPDIPAPPNNPNTLQPYDSTVDSRSYPTIFVVFKDASVYPSYIITYHSY